MIRKVYSNFLREKLAKREFRWLLSRGTQYALTFASFMAKRPFCGPILGTLVTNYTCNYRCQMCDLRLRDKELKAKGLRELDTAGMKKVLDDFAGLHVSGVGFTGGEPLLRNDIYELLAHAKTRGMISHLNTNGYFLDENAAKSIIDAHVDSINISLDGARASTHDRIRGFAGAFDHAVLGIRRLDAARRRTGALLRIKTVAVISEENVDEYEDMISLARDLNVDCIEFIPRQSFLSNAEPARSNPSFLGKIDNMTRSLLDGAGNGMQIENSPSHLRLFNRSFRNRESPLRCYAGYNSLAVDCYGEIYPCVPWYNWRHAVGNIVGQDLRKFWYSAEYNGIRKEIAGCRKCYLNCQAELNILFNPFSGGVK